MILHIIFIDSNPFRIAIGAIFVYHYDHTTIIAIKN